MQYLLPTYSFMPLTLPYLEVELYLATGVLRKVLNGECSLLTVHSFSRCRLRCILDCGQMLVLLRIKTSCSKYFMDWVLFTLICEYTYMYMHTQGNWTVLGRHWTPGTLDLMQPSLPCRISWGSVCVDGNV